MNTKYNSPNKNFMTDSGLIRMHVFEPEESVNKEDWYKDLTTFSNANLLDNIKNLAVGDIVEDDSGARFRILSRHWKWQRDDKNTITPVFELTVERYMRRGKQNPYML